MITEKTKVSEAQLLIAFQKGDVSAISALRECYEDPLIARLLKRGASASEAADVVADIFSDCISMKNGGASLLEKYTGRASLMAWLSTVTTNRFIDYKRRERFQISADTVVGSNLLESQTREWPHDSTHQDLVQLLRQALSQSFKQCPPDAKLMLSLVYIDGVSQRKIAEMWNWHESKVSRYIQKEMNAIATRTLHEVKQTDPWLSFSWEDFGEFCHTIICEFF